jgi:hypothetical protein
MSMVLYWIHDDSPGRQRTRRFIDHTVDVVVRCIALASNPFLRPLRKRVLAMLDDLQL